MEILLEQTYGARRLALRYCSTSYRMKKEISMKILYGSFFLGAKSFFSLLLCMFLSLIMLPLNFLTFHINSSLPARLNCPSVEKAKCSHIDRVCVSVRWNIKSKLWSIWCPENKELRSFIYVRLAFVRGWGRERSFLRSTKEKIGSPNEITSIRGGRAAASEMRTKMSDEFSWSLSSVVEIK